ncbi:uncharacterized protein LOC129763270 [Toxorhynchites rutilus septentrionalis]|uniref:uncharacterized protein LOC129763270 n=1 Tax=Toxorhynchites rutilus septentrionalis TaxID=329112 RepID=UPI0024791E0E|nr:uncharacterized protein LOC129763270 [Toxorhynchites rutilus septentrionalis]
MSTNKAKRNSTVIKTKQQIVSKIDSGVAKKSSRLVRPFTGNESFEERKATVIPDKTRPKTSSSSSARSSSPKPESRPQQEVQPRSKIPVYLWKSRPAATAAGKKNLKNNVPNSKETGEHGNSQKNLAAQHRKHQGSKSMLSGDNTAIVKGILKEIAEVCVQTGPPKSEAQTVCPPFEGSGSIPTETQTVLEQRQQLSEMRDKNQQLEIKCAYLQERVVRLEREIQAKEAAASEREKETPGKEVGTMEGQKNKIDCEKQRMIHS